MQHMLPPSQNARQYPDKGGTTCTETRDTAPESVLADAAASAIWEQSSQCLVKVFA